MNIINIIGGILFGGFFVYNGVLHFVRLEAYSGYAQSKRVPASASKFVVLFTGIMLFIGGLSIMTGFFDQAGVWILVLFMFGTTFVMHQFWKADATNRAMETIQFTKNIAILGALLMIAVK